MDSEIQTNSGAHGDGTVRSMKCSATAYNKNTCPGCGGPGQKHPDEKLYHCPNNWCDVKLFQPRTQLARGDTADLRAAQILALEWVQKHNGGGFYGDIENKLTELKSGGELL